MFERDEYIRLSQVFPNGIIGNGIFSQLDGMPWSGEVDGATLDIQYFGNISGDKIISPLLKKLLKEGETLDIVSLSNVVKIIKAMFSKSWESLYKAITADYNPIQNYDMTEESTDNEEINENGSNTGTQENARTYGKTVTDTVQYGKTQNNQTTYGKTETDTITHGEIIKTDDIDRETMTRKVSAFNETDPQTASIDDNEISRDKTEAHSGDDVHKIVDGGMDVLSAKEGGTDTHNIIDGGSDIDKRTDDLSHEVNTKRNLGHKLTRSGNIGVTTSQQMIESEIELRKQHFFNMVFRDVDSVLTIQIY